MSFDGSVYLWVGGRDVRGCVWFTCFAVLLSGSIVLSIVVIRHLRKDIRCFIIQLIPSFLCSVVLQLSRIIII